MAVVAMVVEVEVEEVLVAMRALVEVEVTTK